MIEPLLHQAPRYRETAIRPAVGSGTPRAGFAVFSGKACHLAVRALRGNRPGAGFCWHLWRGVLFRHPVNARDKRPHGFRGWHWKRYQHGIEGGFETCARWRGSGNCARLGPDGLPHQFAFWRATREPSHFHRRGGFDDMGSSCGL